jgi:hypothetical protein
LQAWDALHYVVADAGRPLQAGIARVQAQRRQDQQDPLASGLDAFHTKGDLLVSVYLKQGKLERAIGVSLFKTGKIELTSRLFGTRFARFPLPGKVTAILAETSHGGAIRQPDLWT